MVWPTAGSAVRLAVLVIDSFGSSNDSVSHGTAPGVEQSGVGGLGLVPGGANATLRT